MRFTIEPIAVNNHLQNYIWLLIEQDRRQCVVIDPTYAEPVLFYCQREALTICQIWLTHKHVDHTGGVQDLLAALAQQHPITVYAPAAEQDVIGQADYWLADGDHIRVFDLRVEVLATPGHTLGSLSYYLPNLQALFSGDTLFAMGCGRMFEGTPAQFYASLQRLAQLPADTQVYCSHEYTLTNAEFALQQHPDDPAIISRTALVREQRARNQVTLPSTIAQERLTNVFIRATNPTEFARLRQLKDHF